MDNSPGMMQKLAGLLMGGSSSVGNAANALNNRAYQLYAQEAQATGAPVMTPQQFAAQQSQQAQPAPQPAAQPATPPQPFRF